MEFSIIKLHLFMVCIEIKAAIYDGSIGYNIYRISPQ